MMRLIVGTLGVLLLAGRVSAATFTVDSTADAVDAATGNGTCATAAGTCTLRAAVQEANALAGPDVIMLPAGTYFLTLVGPGEDAAATGDLDVTQALEVVGAGADVTIVDGVGNDRGFHVAAGNAFTLRHLTVRNGVPGAANGGGLWHQGGAPVLIEDAAFVANRSAGGSAMLVEDGALTLRRTRIADNLVLGGAGTVLHGAMAQPLEVRDAVFERNAVPDGSAGALLYQGTGSVVVTGTRVGRNAAKAIAGLMLGTSGGVLLENVVIEDNRAADEVGGLFVSGASSVDLRNTTVRGNTAEIVGGVYVLTTGPISVSDSMLDDNEAGVLGGGVLQNAAGALTIQNTSISGNRALDASIGGMQLTSAGPATLTGVTVRGNTAASAVGGLYTQSASMAVREAVIEDNVALAGDVGGLYVAAGGAATIEDSLVRGNAAFDGIVGGLYLVGVPSGISGSTIAENVAVGVPGAAAGVYATAVTVVNSTFSNNLASNVGAGLYATVGGTVDSSTFVGNTSVMPGSAIVAPPALTIRGTAIGAGSGASCLVAITSGGDNVDQDGSCGLAGPRDRSGIDPQLGPLQDNGGPTPTHEPLEGGPLVDADGGICPTTDQRGVARPTDGNGDGTPTCDVGAVELVDECPQDPAKRFPGACGCGVPDVDANANGAFDCLLNAELKARIATEKTSMQAITGEKSDAQKALKATVKAGADDLLAYIDANGAGLVLTDPAADLPKLGRKARKAVRKTLKGKGKALQKKQARAGTALDALDAAVAPQ